MLENFEEQNLTLKLSKESLSYLKETAKWGKFLAIVGFVMSGLLIVFGFFAGSIFAKLGEIPGATPSPINPVFFSVFYMLFAAIYVLPCYFLYKYSTDLKSALNNTNSDKLTEAFKNQKSLYKFIGILTAVILGLYLLIFVVAAIGGAAYFMSMSK
jgi:uncharacterized integral membrane protein